MWQVSTLSMKVISPTQVLLLFQSVYFYVNQWKSSSLSTVENVAHCEFANLRDLLIRWVWLCRETFIHHERDGIWIICEDQKSYWRCLWNFLAAKLTTVLTIRGSLVTKWTREREQRSSELKSELREKAELTRTKEWIREIKHYVLLFLRVCVLWYKTYKHNHTSA